MDKDFEVVILSACRTPIGAFGGALKDVSAVDLGAIVIREAIARAGVTPADIGDAVMGCVLQAGAGMNVARQAGLKAGLPVEVPGETVNRVCGSGLQAVVHAVEAIRVGYVDAMVAGGTESMSNAPYLLKGARWGYRMGNGEAIDSMLHEGLTCAIGLTHMGITAEEVATRYDVSRADQDAFAAESQRARCARSREGRFKDEIVAGAGAAAQRRSGAWSTPTSIRAPARRRRSCRAEAGFKKDGTVTAGNASGINDGAAALVVTTREEGAGARTRSRWRASSSYVSTGVDPKIMGIGPVPAVRKVLERAGLTIGDIDLFELNEAFAAQSVAVVRELGLDPAKVNVNGGAIALGHPIGASGARVLTTLIYALRARKLRYGVASLCIGGGMGIAMAVENL